MSQSLPVGHHPKRRCDRLCPCICHDTGGSAHDHEGHRCPGKRLTKSEVDAWRAGTVDPSAPIKEG